jgi:hypothetical protein
LRGRLADRTVAGFARLGAASIRPVAPAGACRSTVHAVVGIAPTAEGPPLTAGLLRIAGPGPTGGIIAARTGRTVTAPVGFDRGLLARAAEPSAGAATGRRRTALSKGIADSGAAQPRDARAQTAETAEIRGRAGLPGRRRLALDVA